MKQKAKKAKAAPLAKRPAASSSAWEQLLTQEKHPAAKPPKQIKASAIKDQTTGCVCSMIVYQDGTKAHEWWCSWWDLHPEAVPF